RGRHQRFDPVAQMRRRGLLQRCGAHDVMHGAERCKLFAAARTGSHMRLDVAGMPGVEFAVDQRMKQNFRFAAVHNTIPEAMAGPRCVVAVSAAFQAVLSMARARASRDITVPTGTPATWAISW